MKAPKQPQAGAARAPERIDVRAKPNARVSMLFEEADGTFTAHLKAPPVDGKANEELVALVAAHFGVRKAAVRIKTGAGSRFKRVEIDAA